jgi:hypothetical protein
MLFKEIIAAYSKNHMKDIIRNPASLIVKADGSYSYRSALKGRNGHLSTTDSLRLAAEKWHVKLGRCEFNIAFERIKIKAKIENEVLQPGGSNCVPHNKGIET